MKFSLKSSILVIASVVILSSCTREIAYDFEDPGPRLAISASIDPATGFEAFLTTSVAPGQEGTINDLWVADAEVILITENGASYQAEHMGSGYYTVSDSVITDYIERFSLSVMHPDFPNLISEWIAVPKNISSPVINRDDRVDGEGFVNRKHTVKATDESGEEYYYLEVYPVNNNVHQFQIFVETDIRTDACEYYNFHPPYGIFFSDICVDNREFSIDITPDFERSVYNEGEEQFFTSYEVALRSVSKSYYEFQLDRINLESEEGTVIEARPTESNIQGGYGVFTAANSFVRRFQRPL